VGGDTLRDHLQAIYDTHGKLTPAIVVAEASDPAHPLHGKFEWDDSVAGQRYREQQAGGLIRKVRIVVREATETEPEHTVRGFHSTLDEDHKPVYRPLEEIASNPLAREMLLREMRRDIIALKRRYEGVSEFLGMVHEELGKAS
jgi:hypothetical protein